VKGDALELTADSTLSHPRSVAFAAYRDRLPELVPHLPNIRAIEVKRREEQGSLVQLHNVWRGGGEIPAVARALVSESMLSWDDHACWDEQAWSCTWRIETHVFREAFYCQGENRFVELDQGSRLEIRGTLRIDASKIPGVPRPFRRRVSRLVEEYLAARIGPNLAQVASGLELFLQRSPGAGE
jgi:hypothetical protein